jgi:hypothetical protein
MSRQPLTRLYDARFIKGTRIGAPDCDGTMEMSIFFIANQFPPGQALKAQEGLQA